MNTLNAKSKLQKILLMVCMMSVPMLAVAESNKSLGIKERKLVNAFMSNEFPKLKADIEKSAGYKVKIDVDWESIGSLKLYSNPASSMSKVFFEPLALALKAVNVDDITTAALKSHLKRIVVKGSNESFLKPEYESGVLKIEDRIVNVSNVKDRAEKLKTLLEKIIGLRPYKSNKEIILENLSQLPGTDLKRVITKLAYLYTQWLKDETVQVPVGIFHLNTGNSIKGYIVREYDSRTRNNVLIVDRIKSTPKMLTYVPVSEIQTISIDLNRGSDYLSQTIYNLSFGQLKMPPAKIPGRLAVNQQAVKLAKNLTKQLGGKISVSIPWTDVESTDTASANLSHLLTTIGEIIEDLSKDTDVKKALSNNLTTVKIALAEKENVVLKSKTLLINVTSNDMNLPWSKKKIMERINNGL